MFSGFFGEISRQIATAQRAVRTREFWIYMAVILALLLLAVGAMYFAAGFDPLTRSQMKMAMSCRAGEGKIATIIIGVFVFSVASVFTLGEVTHWVEMKRMSRAPGRREIKLNPWRPLLAVAGTVILGGGGVIMLLLWCS